MSDLISRQVLDLWNRYRPTIAVDAIEYDRELKKLLGTNLAEVGTDCISRQAAIEAVNGLIDRFEQILRDIREANVDDSVCGMCEYDGAYIGQSGDWCNECPGFVKDDCFKLSDECRKRWLESVKLPPAQPDIIRCRNCKFASGDSRICMKFGHSPIGELDFCSFAERREVTT